MNPVHDASERVIVAALVGKLWYPRVGKVDRLVVTPLVGMDPDESRHDEGQDQAQGRATSRHVGESGSEAVQPLELMLLLQCMEIFKEDTLPIVSRQTLFRDTMTFS